MRALSERRIQVELSVLIFSVLLIQLVGNYYALHVYKGFWVTVFLIRMVSLGLIVFPLKLKFSECGFCWPTLKSRDFFNIIVLVTLLTLAIIVTQSEGELTTYYHNALSSEKDRLIFWVLFTVSTTFTWEFLHRGLLLFGLKKILDRARVTVSYSGWLSCLVVCAFETLFHLNKPPLECFGMLLFSPILSLIALQTRSIVIPLLIHSYIEAVFYLFVVAQV